MAANCPKPDGWFSCIARMRGEYSDVRLTGKTDIPLAERMKLDVTVQLSNRANQYGPSYDILEMKVITDSSQNTIAYLSSFPGIGRTTATKIEEAFGNDAVKMLQSDPKTVADKTGLNQKTVDALARYVSEPSVINKIRQLLPEVRSPQMIKRIKETFTSYELIEETANKDPYKLYEKVPGLSFSIVDQIALRILSGDAFCPYRVNHGLVHLLQTKTTNDLYIDLNDPKQLGALLAELENLLNIRLSGPQELLSRLLAFAGINDSPIKIVAQNGCNKLYLTETYEDMVIVSNTVRNAAAKFKNPVPKKTADFAISQYEASTGFCLTDEQRTAVLNAIINSMSVITGGPGRGKTTIVDCLATILSKLLLPYSRNVVLLAPTGKAMAKLQTATHDKFTAMTIDKLIVAMEHADKVKNSSTAQARTIRDLQHTTFIIDETSMVDMNKLASLFRHASVSNYCFIGDTDQLPPIGRGRVFRDIIASGRIPVTYLTKPLRNGGKILENANRIISGDTDIKWDFNEMAFYPEPNDDQHMMDTILDVYAEEKANCPDITEIALLSPIRRGPVGVGRINLAIQALVCPETQAAPIFDTKRGCEVYNQRGYSIGSATYRVAGDESTKFRIGDIVMNVKNNYQVTLTKFSNDDYWNGTALEQHTGIFNGDCGRIIGYFPHMPDDKGGDYECVVVQLFNGLIVELNLTMGDFENIELAYAMTVHKSQGCEYKTVIYVSPDSMKTMTRTGFANRNILYTGVTRAKAKVVVIGSKDSINQCISTQLPDCNSDVAYRIAHG